MAGIINQDGVIDGRLGERSDRVVATDRTFSYVLHRGSVPMQITQNDVRAIQLAKAALHAGIRLLMDHLGVERVDRIRLAGAFGSHIDAKYAMVLGMIPDCELDQVASVGNAAGAGARIALLDATAIPHKSAAYPELRKVVELPAVRESAAQGATRGRRGRRATTP